MDIQLLEVIYKNENILEVRINIRVKNIKNHKSKIFKNVDTFQNNKCYLIKLSL